MSVDHPSHNGVESDSSVSTESANRETLKFDDFPPDVLRLVLDHEGLNARNARGTMRLFNDSIKRDCRCVYDPVTDTFDAPVIPSSGLERDSHCLSGTKAVSFTTFCERLTDTWALLCDRMNDAMADERTGDKKATSVFETIRDAIPRERDLTTTRLLLEAFREYLFRCLARHDTFGLSHLWNVVLANYRLNFGRARFEFAMVVEMLCDHFSEGFLIMLAHYTDLRQIPEDELTFMLSRLITNIARESRFTITELTRVFRMVGIEHESFHQAFEAYRSHTKLSVRSLQDIRSLFGEEDERYVGMLHRFMEQ
ncbi:hypothetical protein CYMTET_41434 [Cymbomonas tetramitiformis]|uniref:Uncharacterized protein n=1 Tax=Cymbomonas tetramitiformis TaxID=36881 RepID=A0AAE0F217_9CHLO|nr:hypothetical protein CYMTET_41434 [Cymbomonas tetramitiformis]